MDKLQPEIMVVSQALRDAALTERIALRAEHFGDALLGSAWSEIADRHRAGRAVDAGAMRGWFDRYATAAPGLLFSLVECGGILSVHELEYEAEIKAGWRKRRIAAAAQQALHALCDDPAAVMAQSLAALDESDNTRHAGGLLSDTNEFFDSLDRQGLSTGLESLDRRLGGMYPGELLILAGRPSMGKSTLATQIMRNVALHHRGVHFASLEMSRAAVQQRAISGASFSSSVNPPLKYFSMKAGLTEHERSVAETCAQSLSDMVWVDDTAAQGLDHLERSARATRRRLGRLDLIIVDYLQLMRATRTDGRVHEVAEISQGLKGVAKRLSVPVLALSQLSRSVEGRENKRPTLSDLRDSGAIEQDADVVLGMYRESYYHERDEPDAADAAWLEWNVRRKQIARELEVATLKQRMGPIGVDRLEAWLEFDTIIDKGVAA